MSTLEQINEIRKFTENAALIIDDLPLDPWIKGKAKQDIKNLELLLKAFDVMREIAIGHKGCGDCDKECQDEFDQEFELAMLMRKD